MPRGGAGRRAGKGRRRDRGRREWIGGLLTPPFFVTDRDPPYRPGMVLWIEAPDGLIVGQDLVAPEAGNGAVGRVLLEAIERPLAGSPRRPDAIRMADASLASEVRAALGDATPIEIAPTPELDAILELMAETMPEGDEDWSYLENGRVPPAAVADLFAAAARFYRLAPWRVATDDRVLRLDIPALGVEGACVSILGNLGEAFGVVIFPSLASYDAFSETAEEHFRGRGPFDLGSGWLALEFERGADLPDRLRREVADHRWPVAAASAYPLVVRRERDGASRPIVERDVRTVTACITALAAFFTQHQGLFEREDFEPVCVSYFDADLEVRFTLPYEAFELFDVTPAAARPTETRRTAGRNDPCPCGSGRKYKRCHLPADEAERASQRSADAGRDLTARLVRTLQDYADRRFGAEWWRFEDDFVDAGRSTEIAVAWSLFAFRVRGRSVLEWYVAEHGSEAAPKEREWFAAEAAAWLSIWEVVGVEPGVSVTLRDLLSHEERCVREATASRTLVLRDALLGRVIDRQGFSLLGGVHPRALPPLDAAEVESRARGRLRRKRAVPVERLRDETFGRSLIASWEAQVADLDRCAEELPRLQNSDGDPVLLTTDRFRLAPGARRAVARSLGGLPGAMEPEDIGGGETEYVLLSQAASPHAEWGRTVIGRICLGDSSLRLESNSRARADALRTRVETACGDLIRHLAREHSDPLSSKLWEAEPGRMPPVPSPEQARAALEFKRRHYADWPDCALPALGGRSPREAVRTAQGRASVDLLLRDMENREERAGGPDAFDFGPLRRELGLDQAPTGPARNS